ncbi:hypothetical protein BDV09DRAFT_199842 [Aspergillus tetrazonus]
MCQMEKFNFFASVKQYERQLKTWKFCKKRTGVDWKIIGHKIRKRERQGKLSLVMSGDEVVPEKKIKKETSRHAFTTFEALKLENGSVPATPEGFSISTPPAWSPERTSHRNNDDLWAQWFLTSTVALENDSSSLYYSRARELYLPWNLEWLFPEWTEKL